MSRINGSPPIIGAPRLTWGDDFVDFLQEIKDEINGFGDAVDHNMSGIKSRRDVMLASAGLLSENFPFEFVAAQTVLATGAPYGALHGLNVGDVVTGVVLVTATAGAGTVPTLFKVGLADSAGNIVAKSANENANAKLTTANTMFSLPFTAPYTVTAQGGFRSLALQVGAFATTPVQFGRGTPIQSATMSAAFAGGLRRLCTYGSALADFGATLGTAANASITLWMGLY